MGGRLSRMARLRRALTTSLLGLGHALRRERAFQEETLVLVLLVVPGALRFGPGAVGRALLIGSWLLVMVVELLNTAIETTVDRIGLDHHELSRQAKDLGSAAVFLSILLAVTVWLCVLL
ncbi:MAG: diacylglycerol kinase [Lentisphaeria bacterium]|nr:diacylglycerol kinase [Lentisphaeria bacterium]